MIKHYRSRQDSNLRGETPTDFKSVALTARPRLLVDRTMVSKTLINCIWTSVSLFWCIYRQLCRVQYEYILLLTECARKILCRFVFKHQATLLIFTLVCKFLHTPLSPWEAPVTCTVHWAGIFKKSMGATNRPGIGMLYRLARLHSLVSLVPWNRFLGSLTV